ncbi:MAG: SDR family oxidoreductase [Algicola sp.]|nr:SDR family oxidoreductase [Algicola sp.]
MYDFNGRSIIVTGGATGIGCGITQMLLEYGANVLAVGRRDYEIVDEQLKKHSAFGYLQADINHPPDRQRIIQTAIENNARLDVLINNAGARTSKAFVDLTDDDIYADMATNLTSPMILCREAIPHLKQSKGCIINISSIAANHVFEKTAAYGTAKAGLNQFTCLLAQELGKYDIRVNAISPGWVETQFTEKYLSEPQNRQAALGRMGLNRIGQPMDIANAACFLASEQAQWVTGQIFEVSGGFN